jgi:hypothetical protein
LSSSRAANLNIQSPKLTNYENPGGGRPTLKTCRLVA